MKWRELIICPFKGGLDKLKEWCMRALFSLVLWVFLIFMGEKGPMRQYIYYGLAFVGAAITFYLSGMLRYILKYSPNLSPWQQRSFMGTCAVFLCCVFWFGRLGLIQDTKGNPKTESVSCADLIPDTTWATEEQSIAIVKCLLKKKEIAPVEDMFIRREFWRAIFRGQLLIEYRCDSVWNRRESDEFDRMAEKWIHGGKRSFREYTGCDIRFGAADFMAISWDELYREIDRSPSEYD